MPEIADYRDDYDVMEAEWQAWQDWHKAFTELTGIDINDAKCRHFVTLTQRWGGYLTLLRISQGAEGIKWTHNVIEGR